jgi:hypothetical protein
MLPPNLQPLVDGDIIRYEIGYASEVGWRAKTQRDESPPFSYVSELLHQRLADISSACNTIKKPRIFFTTGKTFRFDIATKKPYKGTRIEKKPFHFDNLTVYLRDIMGAEEVTGIEADDQLAIEHVSSNGETILVSRDKDLKQVPGWFYSWELNLQPSWGPGLITKEGSLKFTPGVPALEIDGRKFNTKPPKLTGTGYSWFMAQCLIGDSTDNIPGLPMCGPVAAYNLLTRPSEAVEGRELLTPPEMLSAVIDAYAGAYGYTDGVSFKELTEQAQLVWLVRRLNPDGSPELWRKDLFH